MSTNHEAQPPAPRAQPRSPWTTAAALIALAVTARFAFLGFGLLQLARDPTRIGRDEEVEMLLAGVGTSTTEVGNLAAISATLFLTLSLLTTVLALGVLARREWARHGSLVTFIAFALIAIGVSLGGVTADPPTPGAVQGLLVGVADAVVVALLLTPWVADDFERTESRRRRAKLFAERERLVRKQERRPAG